LGVDILRIDILGVDSLRDDILGRTQLGILRTGRNWQPQWVLILEGCSFSLGANECM